MNTFLIKNVKIVMGSGIIENGFLYVQRGIIRNLGRANPARVHRSCRVIDGQGAFLMPGFVDMSNSQLAEMGDSVFHTAEQSLYRHGVTSVFHMIPEYAGPEENKWEQLRRMGLIRHHFITKPPVQNSFYMIGTSTFNTIAFAGDSRKGDAPEHSTENPTILDMIRHPDMYVICSDGSQFSMLECVQFLIRTNSLRLEEAVRMISTNPARALGIDGRQGSVEWGKRADLVLVDSRQGHLEINRVLVNGCIIYSRNRSTVEEKDGRLLTTC